ncbi:RNA methyltransferase [Halobacteriovorax sp. HLS]|uniref:RNA methyltransferase n=1 Tax=Halobacteriovorax sp. HLS TaxID=2234000 RepID=UPI000FD7DE5A|nr:RNA methyltransferase [Halobacteriovorax sp. HLS]
MANLYLGLVHHPIKNKRGDTVTTSVTNLDIHDIARSCKTFGVQKYFIVTPLEAQHGLVKKILGHWEDDKNGAYNPDRQNALSIATLVNSVDEAMEKIQELENKSPLLAVTGANFDRFDGNSKELRQKMESEDRPCLLLFGTGWGLHEVILEKANFMLDPILGANIDGYNHLSVRSAVAIYLDRFNQK